MKKILIISALTLVASVCLGQSGKIVMLDSATYEWFMTAKVIEVNDNKVVLQRCEHKKYKMDVPTDMDVRVGDKFKISEEVEITKKLAWADLKAVK